MNTYITIEEFEIHVDLSTDLVLYFDVGDGMKYDPDTHQFECEEYTGELEKFKVAVKRNYVEESDHNL